MPEIICAQVGFQYKKNQPILENINCRIESGKLTAIIGRNGCGKSTLVKLIAALLPLSTGEITIDGTDIRTKTGLNLVRQHCGIVFQNPDNQFVSPIIEDDISFGLNNHHIPEDEQKSRIKSALDAVGLSGYEKRSITSLSGGQKQRAAIAGILAMDSDIFIFDEATSMLDPEGKEEVLQVMNKLKNLDKTIIVVTQNISDILNADQVILIENHRIISAGTAREVLTDYDHLREAGIEIPFPVRVYHDLSQQGIQLKHIPLSEGELAEELCCWN